MFKKVGKKVKKLGLKLPLIGLKMGKKLGKKGKKIGKRSAMPLLKNIKGKVKGKHYVFSIVGSAQSTQQYGER